ncbi:4F2 cell-surface antigen heavy chain [Mastacembelus armatus]|uniref:4F2 cell-surface antigen heavy chain n=1 Tax=Mastacembelus armatus TaxID=205130 RepID=UPI000E45BFCB|nr:4F2 cell-surface antigen heavy chain-like [Mastacembelus armatus]
MEQPEKVVAEETGGTPGGMPVDAGDPGYGTVPALGQPGSVGSSETAPLLVPEPGAEPFLHRKPMTKEELEATAGGPWWRRVRCYLLLVFFLALLAILATAIAIIVRSPRPVVTPLKWWQRSLFYRLQPALLTEAQAQGSRRISGLHEQLPYLRSLGIGVVILEGLFHEDMTLVNHNLTGRFGMLSQIQHLLTESNKTGLKMVLDLCELSLLGPRDVASNPATVQHALRFWLHQGVAGFAICDTDAFFSEQTLLEWRHILEEFSDQEGERIVVLKQTRDILPLLNTFSQINVTLVDVVMRSILPSSSQFLSALEVAVAIRTQLQAQEQPIWPSWTIGGKASHDLKKLLLMLLMTLPGTPAIQYDEEIIQTQKSSTLHGVKNQSLNHLDNEINSTVALFNVLRHTRAREEALLYGNFTFLPFNTSSNSTLSSPPPHPILAFLRSWACVKFLVLLNVGPEFHALDPAWIQDLPETGVFITSTGMDRIGLTSLYMLELQPHEAVVIRLQAGSSS